MKSGTKFKFSITFEAEILSEEDEITESQIIETIYNDSYFINQNVIVGKGGKNRIDLVLLNSEISFIK